MIHGDWPLIIYIERPGDVLPRHKHSEHFNKSSSSTYSFHWEDGQTGGFKLVWWRSIFRFCSFFFSSWSLGNGACGANPENLGKWCGVWRTRDGRMMKMTTTTFPMTPDNDDYDDNEIIKICALYVCIAGLHLFAFSKSFSSAVEEKSGKEVV